MKQEERDKLASTISDLVLSGIDLYDEGQKLFSLFNKMFEDERRRIRERHILLTKQFTLGLTYSETKRLHTL